MCTNVENLQHRTIEVELVDNWHPRWREVLDSIDFLGQRDRLQVDSDGWLPARQNLLVVFVDEAIAGHVSFSVQPARDACDQPGVEAHLESLGVQSEFARDEIESLLRAAASKRAQSLRCQRFIGV
jgi:hypothetical protein